MHNDKAHQKADKGSSGVVGESAIWDGPLDQTGRLHGSGSSSGITGMQVLKAPTMYKAGPITQIAKGDAGLGMN
jgi:hypothetical protein|tara:strand:- start:257 stop:478 length:222 start_codon:yes stop_codon:yes gene_type:complete